MSSPKTDRPESTPGIKLPRISVPLFNRTILNWTTFWEQFEIAVHSKGHLQVVKKLANLRDAVKGGPTRHMIGGLCKQEEAIQKPSGILKSGMIGHD